MVELRVGQVSKLFVFTILRNVFTPNFQGEAQTTWPQYYDNNPVFEQGFVFTVVNPHSDDLHIRVLDSGHKNAVIGTATLTTSDLMSQSNMEYVKQPFNLKGMIYTVGLCLQFICPFLYRHWRQRNDRVGSQR